MIARSHVHTWQGPVESVADRFWDTIIVGAGPAGSIAAMCLAEQGFQVLAIDKQRFPRDKVCGDALIPDSIRCLRRTGLYSRVAQVGYHTREVAIYSPAQIMVALSGEFITLKRLVFDEILAREAVRRGAVLCHGQATGVRSAAGRRVLVSCRERERPLQARVAVIATGADVSLLRPLGMVDHGRASAVALRAYVRSAFKIDRLVLSFDRSIIPGYAWIFPVGGDEYNVGCGILYARTNGTKINLCDTFASFVREFPLCRALMAQSTHVTPFRGARLRCGLNGVHSAVRGRVLAIGEAIDATFPFTGEGIGKAMETGEIAARLIGRALAEDDIGYLHTFSRCLEKELKPRYMGYQIAEDWLGRAWLNNLVMRRARKSRYLREAMNGIIAETVDPRDIFSVRGLLRSLWG